MTRTLIIAEAGVNHDGDLARAKKLVEVAAGAGADAVKFQTFKADRLATAAAAKARYQLDSTAPSESQHSMLKRLELTEEMHEQLLEHCARSSIEFLSSAFDIPSLEMLEALGVSRIKIPSGEITNLPYLRRVGELGKPVILSTGMAESDEIAAAIGLLEASGTLRERITVLHCTSAYPAPLGEVNLRAMVTIGEKFGVAVGYSDHTTGIDVPVAAVALGAVVIEKHFTLDRTLPGPDHRASLEPGELGEMVRSIRRIEEALGDGAIRVGPTERENRAVVRKSIVAAGAIRAGEVFTESNITVERPGTGLSPMEWDKVVGRVAKRDFIPDESIEP